MVFLGLSQSYTPDQEFCKNHLQISSPDQNKQLSPSLASCLLGSWPCKAPCVVVESDRHYKQPCH
uniref:Uncharacterized protein n=1 Tax=Anguilla anguilla TaxID=7936 RepID=A0A0E9TCA4_ANGAN